ncbi:hypothetical protein Poli38472_004739 [Pythium oligandrum]|uniref:Transmembrane protein n=1 Tax=Pythium oligandrum TaxID=41045 RepID=A0A8K1FDQ6_PYTOL|nr:hypothetical protein Poli38472_004739 [Pythium oligandrum]|eukprot:TMW59670.1 hypothetical protein Poli38472_004739 [Pythium oligandrum]
MSRYPGSPRREIPSVALLEDDSFFGNKRLQHNLSSTPGLDKFRPLATGSSYPYDDLCLSDRQRMLSMQGGALQPGGHVNLFARENIGLLVNYFAVGVLNGIFPALVYPLFKVYLNLEGYQSNAASSLLNFAWYLKFPIGFISDSFPLNGYRRKPYIFIGWISTCIVMLCLVCMPNIEPYKRNGEIVNEDAHSYSPHYVLPLMVGSIGYLMADVACDGIMVEYAQRESEATRGQVQTMVYGARFMAEVVGTLIVALGLNGDEYGGTFSHSLPLSVVFGIMFAVGAIALVFTHFNLHEDRVIGQPLQQQVRSVVRLLQHRATWQITVYGFLQFFAFAFDVSPSSTISQVWLKMDPLSSSLAYCLNSGTYAFAAYAMRTYLLNANWRVIMVVAVLAGAVIGLPSVMITVFDVYRNKYFYLAKDLVVGFFDAFAMMVRLVVIVEIAEPGFESSTYSLVTTVYNLAIPVMTTSSNLIGSTFDVYDNDLQDDTANVRWHVAASFFVMYGLRIGLNLLILPLLPKQKFQARELKLHGSSNKLISVLLFSFFGIVFFASMVSNLLSIFESTSCLKFAGGGGC